MEKTYNPSDFESQIYNTWLGKKYFSAKVDKNKTPFTIIMPPPNITSKLHMGHAFEQTIQDIIIRRKRMQGYNALWVPGTDHAALSTEFMLCKQLEREGTSKEELGREKFKERIEQWYKEYKGTIIEQFKRMGYSCDWDRLTFTMDKKACDAVRHVFVHLYKKGWIYKGKRIVNWCPKCKSSISDAEVEFKDVPSHLWHIRYRIDGTNDYIEVATTRPETILGDTAVAVNPNDDRYKSLVGKNVILPLVDKLIPIVADDYVEMDFGTGVVKITPAHDPNDFEVGLRHGLEVIKVIGDDGHMNELAGKYQGLSREDARVKIVEDLKASGNLVKIEDYTHNVGHCERCKTIIEPVVSSQWFVKMQDLAKPAIDAVESGKIKFKDEQYKKSYLYWMKNIKDWCISRQIWSGHDIPIFTCNNCGETIVELTDPTECPKCHSKDLSHELDKLDTWFSSALWPITTLGYPEETEELKYFYPTDVMVTAREIINLWVARMIFSGIEYVGDIPFKDIVINGIVKDANGKKMSKTLGNGVDPTQMIDKYGVDALRFSLFDGVAIESDSRFSEKKVELTRNFLNKIWNASKFVLMQIGNEKVKDISEVNLNMADKWILSELNKTIESVDKKFDKYDIGLAGSEISDFFWTKFCDWYIELSKCNMETSKESTLATLTYVLKNTLKLLHPFIPFITEKIYLELPHESESIMISAWPKANGEWDTTKMSEVMSIIKTIRNTRAEKKVPDNKKIKTEMLIKNDTEEYQSAIKYINKLALISDMKVVSSADEFSKNSVTLTFNDVIINLPLDSMVDLNAELERVAKEKEKLKFEIERSEKMLNNAGFVAHAPAKLIEAEKEKLAKNKALLESLDK